MNHDSTARSPRSCTGWFALLTTRALLITAHQGRLHARHLLGGLHTGVDPPFLVLTHKLCSMMHVPDLGCACAPFFLARKHGGMDVWMGDVLLLANIIAWNPSLRAQTRKAVGSKLNQLISPRWPSRFEIARGGRGPILENPRGHEGCILHVPKLNTYQSSWGRRSRRALLLLSLFMSKKVQFKTLAKSDHCLSSHSRRRNTVPPTTHITVLTDQHVLVCCCLPMPSLAFARVKHATSSCRLPSVSGSTPLPSQVSNTKNLETLISFPQFPLLLA